MSEDSFPYRWDLCGLPRDDEKRLRAMLPLVEILQPSRGSRSDSLSLDAFPTEHYWDCRYSSLQARRGARSRVSGAQDGQLLALGVSRATGWLGVLATGPTERPECACHAPGGKAMAEGGLARAGEVNC